MNKALLLKVKKLAWVHRYTRVGPALLFVAILVVTLLGIYAIERAEDERHKMELSRHAAEIAAGIERRATEHIAILHAAAAVFAVRDEVSAEEFNSFGDGLLKSNAYHGSLGVGWAEVIRASRMEQFEAEQRQLGSRGYTIHPRLAANRNIAVPVVYLSPMNADNRRAIGYDMYSDPVRRRAMDEAVRLGQPVATGRVRLLQNAGNSVAPGFLIYMPVYQRQGGRSSLKGFVYTPFRAQEFLTAAAELYEGKPIAVSLYSDRMDQDNLLARLSMHVAGSYTEQELKIANRKWVLGITMHERPGLSALSRATLAFGLTLAVLVLLISFLIIRRATEDRMVLEWLTEQSSIRNALTRELNHRVKNTLANALSIVALTRRRASSLDDFADQLTARLQALSATHNLLSQSDWHHASIGDLMQAELAPYMHQNDLRVQLVGPEVRLAPNEALSLGLVIHELATNAAKYGALSTEEGRIIIEWHQVSDDAAEIVWREDGGPPVQTPVRRGFGLDLIEKIVVRELGSAIDMQFLRSGVQCRIRILVREPKEFALRSSARLD